MDKQENLKVEGDEIQLSDGTSICQIDGVGQSWDDDAKMAQKLVDRFNSHPALVEDKKKLVEALENISESGFAQYMSMSDMIGGLKQIAIDALSAIKEAE